MRRVQKGMQSSCQGVAWVGCVQVSVWCYDILKSLVDLNIMEHSKPQESLGGDMMFYLTIEGLKLAKTYSIWT